MAKLNKALCSDLWNLLEGVEVGLNKEILAGIIQGLKSNVDEKKYGEDSDEELARYLAESYDAIIKWNFSYDEALGVVNIEFGYNPRTGICEEYTAGEKVVFEG